uniref:non-specific serine/threonine protein kinase n=1 Tax=Romanomermis culicivorax TaxID=13658 RepID=A0A915JHY8_ROMCU
MTSLMLKRKNSIYDARIAGLYDLAETIGKGHFAVVKAAKHVFTGERVAVKVIDKNKIDDSCKQHLFQEVRCMKLVQHPNIVRLYEVIDTQTKLFLILELGDYDMFDYIMRKGERGVEECEAQRFFCQIVNAIAYCHTVHVVHRDLKLFINLILFVYFSIKIIDVAEKFIRTTLPLERYRENSFCLRLCKHFLNR